MESPEKVTEVPGVGEKTAEKLIAEARAYLDKNSPSSPEKGKEPLALSVADGTTEIAETVEPASDGAGLDDASGGER